MKSKVMKSYICNGMVELENWIKTMMNGRLIMDNCKDIFREAKAMKNEMFKIDAKKFSQRERPVPVELRV
jgi:hypothetical protein